MILYALACDTGHRFESWFADSAAFDTLATQGALNCPTCGSHQIAKAIMAPAVVAHRASSVATDPPSVAPPPSAVDVALLDDKRNELREAVRAFREKVMAGTQDVGRRFPEEARRIHDGETPHREIRGQATIGEARALLEDGIMVLPLPTLPEEMN